MCFINQKSPKANGYGASQGRWAQVEKKKNQ